MTALKKWNKDVRGPESDTDPASLKCDVCNYKCERNATLQKHKNAEHGFLHKENRFTEEDTKAPNPLLHPIPSCEQSDRQPALGTTTGRGPQEKLYQLGIRFKRSSKISPLFVHKPPPSRH